MTYQETTTEIARGLGKEPLAIVIIALIAGQYWLSYTQTQKEIELLNVYIEEIQAVRASRDAQLDIMSAKFQAEINMMRATFAEEQRRLHETQERCVDEFTNLSDRVVEFGMKVREGD